ncbi:MAG TPA: 2-dehydropantoate 2-reductase [Sphingomonas sp.]|jgi:2-dehydropantoate 2-reductase|uniref:ketopantoate reductase family protein n=1 Tax=Sphingomonas sp. TaxID=28214 RepID=UPI002EDABC72
MRINRVVIVGAGAMGSFFAARLSEAGADVALVDVDDARLAALARDGVTVDDALGTRTVPVAATRAGGLSGPADLIILFTKGAHTAAAAASVAHLIGPDSYALTLQNGIGNADAIADVVPPDRILVGVTDIPCDLTGPTSVASHGQGRILLGGHRDQDGAAPDAVVALLRGAGLDAAHDPAVQVAIWEKIAFNAAMNALCTVMGSTVGDLDTPAGRRLIAAVTSEVVAVAGATGLSVDADRIAGKIDHALAHHVGHKPSMLQDRIAGRPTEIETINGAVVRIAAAHDVAVPVNRTLADLVRTIEAARRSETRA